MHFNFVPTYPSTITKSEKKTACLDPPQTYENKSFFVPKIMNR